MKEKPRTLERFSDLPDQVAHHILSFLTIRDLTRFGSTSKKCRELYLSAPSLNFKVDASSRRFMTQRAKLLNSLERYLLQRGNNPILCFRVSWVFHESERARLCDEQFRFVSWIQNAVRCNVEVIQLVFYQSHNAVLPVRKFPLPSCIWISTSLRSLVVVSSFVIIQVPSFSFSCNLYSLKLRGVIIEDENFCKWISCSCKCLEELSLENVRGEGLKKFTIESSSLQSISLLDSGFCHVNVLCQKLEDLYVNCRIYSSGTSMNISAPNLKHFRWWGNLMNHLNVGNLMRLEKVELFDLFLSPKVDDFDSLLEVLSGIRRTKVFNLDGMTMKAVFKEGSKPLPLDEISNLGIHIYGLDDDLVPAMVSLLRGMTNLNTLWITSANLPAYMRYSKVDVSGFNMGFWKSQRLAFVSQLKEVRIELANGSNEIELARYLLKHAHNLKKMVLLYPPQQSHLLKKIIGEKIVSTARLVLQKKKK
ncbi:F-box/LRR-repeat protein [Rosa sericea]